MNQQGFSKVATIITITVVALAGWWYWGQKFSPTAGWQTYRNEQFGFEVKTPASAKVFEVPAGFDNLVSAVDFGNVAGINIRITCYKNSRSDRTLEQLMEIRNNTGNPDTGDIKDYQQVIVNGSPALKRVYVAPTGERYGVHVIVLGDEYYCVISEGNQYTLDFDKIKELKFDTFVSTFKFIK